MVAGDKGLFHTWDPGSMAADIKETWLEVGQDQSW